MTNGGVTMGSMENIRANPLKRLVIRTVNNEKHKPRNVDDIPTATASINEFCKVRATPKEVIFL
ncbi:hypothetical protein LA52FAK_29350 [Desulforhopalus sp. 52FAK]